MDTRLLKHYENELAYMRDMGAEFAAAFPKIAARLGMEGIEVIDPYVERLLEGSAFLNARIQLELELQYPQFTSHLLDIIYPHYLGPTPSMMVAELTPDIANPAAAGHLLPRGTRLRSRIVEGAQSPCLFETAHDLTLWPLEVTEAEYIDGRGALVAAGVAGATEARAGLRLSLRRRDGKPIDELDLPHLDLFLGGEGVAANDLYELLCVDCTGIVLRDPARKGADPGAVVPLPGLPQPVGLTRDEALLPLPRQSFDGYRLLQELFAMPERFHFVRVPDPAPAMSRMSGDSVEVFFLLRHGKSGLGASITPQAFRLNCVPAVNLFERRCDRVIVSDTDHEQHVIVDRTAPLDHEIHSVLSVSGFRGGAGEQIEFRPFYSTDEFTAAGGGGSAYFATSRRMRQRTERERLAGARTNYLGSEVYLSLVDPREAPYPGDLSQLAVRARVTNRDLPLLLPGSGRDVFHLPDGGPVTAIATPVPPTRPRPPIAQGEAAWRLISHLSLNYLSLVDAKDGRGPEALRELIGLYGPEGDRGVTRQLEGITGVSTRPIVRRIADEILSTAVRGLEITVDCDEDFFEGTSAYLLVAVLERFFRQHVPINAFTETVLRTQQRGEVARWTAATGSARLI